MKIKLNLEHQSKLDGMKSSVKIKEALRINFMSLLMKN